MSFFKKCILVLLSILLYLTSFSNFCSFPVFFHHQTNVHLFPPVIVYWICFEIKSSNFSSTESSESAKIGGIITVFLIAAVFTSTIITLRRIGYICLRNNYPKVLVCSFSFSSIFIFYFNLRIFLMYLNIFTEENPIF